MDLTTLIEALVGTLLIVQGIGLDKLGNFYDIKSILIVVGETLIATAVSYSLSILIDIPRHIMVLLRGRQYNILKLVDQLVDLTMIARQNGLLALGEKAKEIKNPFFEQSILMIVGANGPDKVHLILERELENMMTRHDAAAGLYEKAPAYAPAFGIVGTLAGLTNMLKGLNPDGSGGASNLGEDMSVALITTFYGSMLLNLIFHPTTKKLHIRQDEEELYCFTIIEGIIVTQLDENPKYLKKHLLVPLKQFQQKELLSKAARNVSEGGEGNREKGNSVLRTVAATGWIPMEIW